MDDPACPIFECWDDGRRWNGWACPLFTLDDVERVGWRGDCST